MAEAPEILRENGRNQAAAMRSPVVKAWFVREVLPLEAALMQFLQANWRKGGDITDLRQDVYVRICEAAQKQIPDPVKPFLFTIARNILIDRVRHEQVVPIEAVSDLDALGVAIDAPGPDRTVMARDELRRLQLALDHLPPRSRDVVVMARIEGLSGREIAARLGISEPAVSQHLDKGMRVLANLLYRAPPDLRRET
jgi:RNA polymerase sigma factor (sigma-70 family)